MKHRHLGLLSGKNRRKEEILGLFVRRGFLLHGTNKKLEILNPDFAFDYGSSSLFGNLKGVYATQEPALAIFFAITPKEAIKSIDISDREGKSFYVENRYRKKMLNGHVYILPRDDFRFLDTTNIVSLNPVKPLLRIDVEPLDFGYKLRGFNRKQTTGYKITEKIDFNKALRIAEIHMKANVIHGINHVLRALIYAKIMASKICPQNMNDILLGVILHDIGRRNDGVDQGHPLRGAILAKRLLKDNWPNADKERILYAIEHHHKGLVTSDPVVGIIWDADRLDLGRVGLKIDTRRLSTIAATKLVKLARIVNAKGIR